MFTELLHTYLFTLITNQHAYLTTYCVPYLLTCLLANLVDLFTHTHRLTYLPTWLLTLPTYLLTHLHTPIDPAGGVWIDNIRNVITGAYAGEPFNYTTPTHTPCTVVCEDLHTQSASSTSME